MHEEILKAIVENTRASRQLTDWLIKAHQDCVTGPELKQAEMRIIAAIADKKEAFEAAIFKATKDLKASSDALEKAVNKNK
jgi:hypothetical protein